MSSDSQNLRIMKTPGRSPTRPAFIIAEPEPGAALSSRKLVIQTGKFNVLTAHTAPEAMEMLQRLPNVDACIVHAQLPGGSPATVVKQWKKLRPQTPVIALTVTDGQRIEGADHHVPGTDPHALVMLLRSLFGDPRSAKDKKGETAFPPSRGQQEATS